MSAPTPELTPYDTGARCEPQLWQRGREQVRSADPDDVGNVDFDNDESATIATVHVSCNEDGSHTVHVMPHVDDDEIEVELHLENGVTRTLAAPHQ